MFATLSRVSALATASAVFLFLRLAHGQVSAQIPLGPENSKSQPNIVFVLTDDQDLHMNSLDYIPLIKKHLIDQGTLYKKHFCTTAVCCPSRVTLWTGKAAHNTNVTDVFPPYGGYPKFVAQGLNEKYLPIWLQESGYNTYYTGKLFNAHTVDNYHNPYAKGWTTSDFLLDPYTYMYLNSSFQRNKEAPISHEGEYSTDVLKGKALGLLEDAVAAGKPFFLGIAPNAPHSNVEAKSMDDLPPDGIRPNVSLGLTPPIPAKRHAHLFKNVLVPRTPNFNPDKASGVSWVKRQPKQNVDNVASNDHFYRNRLRALQAVDELVDELFAKLEAHSLLDNTYIFYTTDNGYHIGQHRLQPGKECGFEEDINIPLIVRGPGVPAGQVTEVVTTHTDLAPTILGLAGASLRADFDGLAIPLTAEALEDAAESRHEHVNVEYWGFAASEGEYGFFGGADDKIVINNTYKGLRVVSGEYSFYYSVWCTNEHELYDLKTDPGQLRNLLDPQAKSRGSRLLGVPIAKVVARLDSLLFVLKTCKGSVCTHPWRALHPQGSVSGLRDALSPRFDDFYEVQQARVAYSRCELGQIIDAEGPQFERDGYVYYKGTSWSDWT